MRLPRGYARIESRDGLVEPTATGAPPVAQREGSPQFRLLGVVEVCRHDADDLVRLRVQHQRPPDDIHIAAELTLPKAVSQHHDKVIPRLDLVGHEHAPHQGTGPQEREQFGGNERDPHPLGIALAGQVARAGERGGHVFEQLIALAPRREVLRIDDVSSPAAGEILLPHHDQLFGRIERRRRE